MVSFQVHSTQNHVIFPYNMQNKMIGRIRESLVLPLRIAEDYIPWYAHVQIMEVFYAQHKGHHSGGSRAAVRYPNRKASAVPS